MESGVVYCLLPRKKTPAFLPDENKRQEECFMGCLGNACWFIFGGAVSGVSWLLAGCLWCVTIVGIPIGLQCFKFAGLSFFPFGKEVVYGGGAGSFVLNVIWLIVSGIPLALEHLAFGALLCVTIVGIPFGLQHFKLAKLALMPFGAEVRI